MKTKICLNPSSNGIDLDLIKTVMEAKGIQS